MNVLNRPAIKFDARNFISIDRRWLAIFWAGVLPFIVDISNNFVQFQLKNETENYTEIYYVNPFLFNLVWILPLFSLFIYPIKVSVKGYFLNCLRKNEFQAGYVYSTASNNYIRFFVTEIIRNIFIALWSMLFVIPGIIKSFSYSMTSYIICDNPTLSSTEAINLSTRITYGFKKDIFFMYLSFIPWYILVSMTLSIGSIYVIPYAGITEAMFYENLKKHAIETGVASPTEFAIY
ncbi:MAG: DUF975 family protein [Oscillospiraceae bacterium]